MNAETGLGEHRNVEVLHEIGERIAASDPLSTVVQLVVEFVSAVVKCDSCFVYVLEGSELILRASLDPRFQVLHELPEDRYEAFLSVPILCRDRLVGVINVQHREPRAPGAAIPFALWFQRGNFGGP